MRVAENRGKNMMGIEKKLIYMNSLKSSSALSKSAVI
jgi:hypothetical protein